MEKSEPEACMSNSRRITRFVGASPSFATAGHESGAERHEAETYLLTGPELLSASAHVHILSTVLGRHPGPEPASRTAAGGDRPAAC